MTSGRPVPRDIPKGYLGKLIDSMWTLHNATLRRLEADSKNMHATGELMALKARLLPRLPRGLINEDAFIAVYATKLGFTVRLVPDALVYIRIPQTPYDLLVQRRRIQYGHMQVKRLLGRFPSVLSTLSVKHPVFAIRLLADFFRSSPSMLSVLPLLITLETFAVLLALSDFLRGGNMHVRWRRAESTKR